MRPEPREHLTPEEVHALIAGATWTVSLEESDGRADPFGDDLPSGESEGSAAPDPWIYLEAMTGRHLAENVWLFRAYRRPWGRDYRIRVVWSWPGLGPRLSGAYVDQTDAMRFAAAVIDLLEQGQADVTPEDAASHLEWIQEHWKDYRCR